MLQWILHLIHSPPSGLGDRLARRGYTFEITEEGEEEEQGPGLLGWRREQQQYALPGREAPLLLQGKVRACKQGMEG